MQDILDTCSFNLLFLVFSFVFRAGDNIKTAFNQINDNWNEMSIQNALVQSDLNTKYTDKKIPKFHNLVLGTTFGYQDFEYPILTLVEIMFKQNFFNIVFTMNTNLIEMF